MDVRLRLPDDPDGGELKQLYDWLTRDQELRHSADITLSAEPDASTTSRDEPGTSMGSAFDIIQLVLDSGIQLASLGLAIGLWRQAQRPRSSVEIRRGDSTVVVSADMDREQILAALDLLNDLEPPPEPEDPPDPDGPEDPGEPEDTPGGPEGDGR